MWNTIGNKYVSNKKLPHPLPYEELSMALKDAFKERLDAGLNFACASLNG